MTFSQGRVVQFVPLVSMFVSIFAVISAGRRHAGSNYPSRHAAAAVLELRPLYRPQSCLWWFRSAGLQVPQHVTVTLSTRKSQVNEQGTFDYISSYLCPLEPAAMTASAYRLARRMTSRVYRNLQTTALLVTTIGGGNVVVSSTPIVNAHCTPTALLASSHVAFTLAYAPL